VIFGPTHALIEMLNYQIEDTIYSHTLERERKIIMCFEEGIVVLMLLHGAAVKKKKKKRKKKKRRC
jgi:hypothetical protein